MTEVEGPLALTRMTARTMHRALFSALSLATLLGFGCDPKAGAGAIGTTPVSLDDKSGPAPVHQPTTAAGELLPARPMPDSGGVTPTLPPQIDPLLDPIDPVDLGKLNVEGPSDPLPWKLTDPAAKSGCTCRLVCAPANDDRSKYCHEMCEGTGC